MKGHPAYSDKKFDQWKSKVSKTLNVAQFKGGAQGGVGQGTGLLLRLLQDQGQRGAHQRATSTRYVP